MPHLTVYYQEIVLTPKIKESHHAVSLAQLNTGKILQLNYVMYVVTTVRHVIKMLRKTGNV